MKNNTKARLILFIFVVIVCFSQVKTEGRENSLPDRLSPPAAASFNSINSIFDDKIENYNNSDFFPQIYDSSLQASIFSAYPDYYELWINGILLSIDNYSSGSYILYSLDNYARNLGNHTIFIWAIGLDGTVGTLVVEFEILALPNEIYITLIKLDDYEYNSSGNELHFSITSRYPNYYMITIGTSIICSDNYTEGELIIFSIDDYEIGVHNVTIWAIGLDGKETEIKAVFTVFSKEEVSKAELEPNTYPSITAFILGCSLIIIPSAVFGFSHRYQQRKKSILPLKKTIIPLTKFFNKSHKS